MLNDKGNLSSTSFRQVECFIDDTFGISEIPQASRIAVLLDGDGAIFLPHLISLGQAGGQKAATLLLDGVKEYILSLGETRQLQISVYIFFNKRGLTETLSRCGHHSARVRFDEFITGFNQATERFMMVDVGGDKEAADSKMRGKSTLQSLILRTYLITLISIFGRRNSAATDLQNCFWR
jgi:hypothetical protein